LRINWLIVGIDAFQNGRRLDRCRRRQGNLTCLDGRHRSRPKRRAIILSKIPLSSAGSAGGERFVFVSETVLRALLRAMPAKTSKTTARPKKPVGRKPARTAPPIPTMNGAPHLAKARVLELQAELDKTRGDTALTPPTKDESLQGAQARITLLEKQLVDETRPASPAGNLEQSLRELRARLTTRHAAFEASRVEAENLREVVVKSRASGEPGKLRCPRCGAGMTEYQQDSVRADRCDSCHGIFFDNGELEDVIKHHDQQLLAGRKHWYSGIFGRQ
jgi:hypothetical protein